MSEERRTLNYVEPAYNNFLHNRASAKGIPLAGNFELTTRCNFNCKMCYVHDNAKKDELTAEQWIEIGRRATEKGMLFLLLTGGEPLLRKDFKQIYKAYSEMGLMISINTNGSLIDDEIIALFKEFPPTRINISLYGSCNDTYIKLCGLPMFDKVVENIKKLKEYNIQVKLNGSITPYNVSDIEGMYRIAEELGTPLKATSYMFPPVRVNGCQYGDAPHRFTALEAAEAQLKCQEQYLTKEEIISTYNSNEVPAADFKDGQAVTMHCRAGKTSFWMTWDGRMLPCGMLPMDGYLVIDSEFDIAWEKCREYAKQVYEPVACAACPKKTQCPSCVASCIAESGSSTIRPEYICRFTQCVDELKRKKYIETMNKEETG